MRVVAALGGNALLRRGETPDAATQRANLQTACGPLAAIARDHALVLTHGNGPQVGLLAVQAGGAMPLDVLGAESEGMIGYLIEQELRNALPGREIAVLLTQVEVDPADPAFANPTKPIGPWYDATEARRIGNDRGWTMAEIDGRFRRVVPSPAPQRILEAGTIRHLTDSGVIVVCAGGGGIPVVAGPDGARHGVEAVIDKDASAALLAELAGADALLLLTDVPAVWTAWREDGARPIRRAPPGAFDRYDFPPGSMGPKVAAAQRFVTRTGGIAAIGALADAADLLAGKAGTLITDAARDIEFGTAAPPW